MQHGQLDRAGLEHFGPERGKLEHLLERDLVQPLGPMNHPGVARVDAVHISVNIAPVGLKRGRKRDCARIRTAAAERRDTVVRGYPLKAGHDRHLTLLQAFVESARLDGNDACRAMHRRGSNRNLPAKPGTGRNPDCRERHRQQPCRDLLARGNHGIVFPCVVER